MDLTEKQLLRKKIRQQRSEITKERIKRLSCLLQANVLSWNRYQEAATVMLYAPMDRELSLIELLQEPYKQFCFPRMLDAVKMEAAVFEPERPMQRAQYGFFAPTGCAVDLKSIDLILLPALACGLDGYRLGYGKGCYDRFLSHPHIKATKAAIVYDEFVLEQMVHETTDVPVDFLITPTKIYCVGRQEYEFVQ